MGAKKVIVIGAGLGGLSAAISLKQSGYDVELFEKNDKIGGKLNVLKERGYTFDLGPSILTLPHIFERLFERSGRKMKDYIPIRALRPHWRNFFEDGVTLDLYPEPDKMAAEARKVGEPPENIERFLKYSADLYDLTNDGYFEQGLDNWQGFAKHYGLFKFFQFDLFRNMHQGVAAHLQTRYFQDIFDFFIKYVGSSAYRAPAFMNSMPTIQFRYDLWYVDGGLYGIALGLGRLMDELGIKVHLNAEVSEVRRENGRVTGLVANGLSSNLDLLPTLLNLAGRALPEVELDGRDISGMLTSGEGSPHDEILLFNNNDVAAVRTARWKLVARSYYRTYDVPLDQLPLLKGLLDKLEVLKGFGHFFRDLLLAPRHQHQGNPLPVWIGLNFLKHLPATHAGQQEIQHDQARPLVADGLHALYPVLGLNHVEITLGQHVPHPHTDHPTIIND